VCDDGRHLHDDEDAELAARRAEAIGKPVVIVGFENADAVSVFDVNPNYDADLAAHEQLVEAQPKPEVFFSPEEDDALREPGGPWASEPASGEQRAAWREAHPELVKRFDEWTKRQLPPPPQRVKKVATVPRLKPAASTPSVDRPQPIVIARPNRSGRAPRGRRVRTAASASRDGPSSSSDDGDDEPEPDLAPAPRGRVAALLRRLGSLLRGSEREAR
jgi:hypothetical protein